MKPTRRAILGGLGAAGLGAVAGCVGGGGDNQALNVGLEWQVLESLDPIVSGIARRTQLYEPLVNLTHDAEFVEGLAESWSVGEDNLTWQFELRPDVVFHDGSAVNADAVEFSLNRANEDAEDFQTVPIDSIDAIGDDRVEIITQEPFSPLLGYLTLDSAWIISPNSFDGDELIEPIGAGPFQFESWEPNERLTTTRFEDYYDGSPTVERVVWEYVQDDQTRALSLQSADLQIGRSLSKASLSTLKDDNGVDLHVYDVPRMRFIVFNNATGPFADVDVRRAVNYAIDRQEIVDGPLEGLTEPAVGPVPPSMAHWPNESLEGYEHDPERAVELLESAGWNEIDEDGIRIRDGERFEITLRGYSAHDIPIIAQVIQPQLAEVGIEMDTTVTEYGALADAKERGEFDMTMESWATIMGGDLDRMFRYFHSTETQIDSGYENPRVDELIEQGRRTLDRDERKELYDEIQAIVMDEVPVAFLTYYATIDASRTSVDGFEPHPIEHTVDVADVEFNPE